MLYNFVSKAVNASQRSPSTRKGDMSRISCIICCSCIAFMIMENFSFYICLEICFQAFVNRYRKYRFSLQKDTKQFKVKNDFICQVEFLSL